MSRDISNIHTIARVLCSSSDAADRSPVEDPATGEVIATVHGAGAAEIDAAVVAAHRAFERDWRLRPAQDRARLMLKCADALEQHADQLECCFRPSRSRGAAPCKPGLSDADFDIIVRQTPFKLLGVPSGSEVRPEP